MAYVYLTIILRARTSTESIAHEAEGQNITNMAGAFRYQWAITYSLVVAQPIRTPH